MCYAKERQKRGGFMNVRFFQRLINELSRFTYPVRVGLGFGGEPLLHPDFANLLKYATRWRNLNINVVTNGVLLHKYVNVLRNTRMRLHVSMDHKNPDVTKAVLKLLEKKTPRLTIELNTVETNFIQDEMYQFLNFWEKRGVTVNVNPEISPDYTMSPKLTRKLNPFCRWPFHHLAVLWDGGVTLCCHDVAAKSQVGRLNPLSSHMLTDFWKSQILKQTRRECVQLQKPRLPGCETCTVWKHSGKYTVKRKA